MNTDKNTTEEQAQIGASKTNETAGKKPEAKEDIFKLSAEDTTKVEAWKKQYGGVSLIMEPGGDKRAWLRSPDRKIVSMVKSLGGSDEVSIAELLLDACWLEGDEELRTNDFYFLAIMPQVNDLLHTKEVAIKKF